MKSCLVVKAGMRWGSMITLQPPSLAFTCSTAVRFTPVCGSGV